MPVGTKNANNGFLASGYLVYKQRYHFSDWRRDVCFNIARDISIRPHFILPHGFSYSF